MGTHERSEPGEAAVVDRPAQPGAVDRPTEQGAVDRPLLRVVRGEPTDEELAALVVAVAMLSGPVSPTPVARSLWRSRSRNIRPAVTPDTHISTHAANGRTMLKK